MRCDSAPVRPQNSAAIFFRVSVSKAFLWGNWITQRQSVVATAQVMCFRVRRNTTIVTADDVCPDSVCSVSPFSGGKLQCAAKRCASGGGGLCAQLVVNFARHSLDLISRARCSVYKKDVRAICNNLPALSSALYRRNGVPGTVRAARSRHREAW